MQQSPPIKTHVGSPSNGSTNRVAASSSTRGNAARILPILMAAGVFICTVLQLWGWFNQGQAFEPLHNKATVSVRATRTGARSSSSTSSSSSSSSSNSNSNSNSRRWVQMPIAAQTQQSTPVQRQQQQQRHNEAAPAPKAASFSAPISTRISIYSDVSPGTTSQPQQHAVQQKEVAPSPAERTVAHPSSKLPPSGVLLPKQHQGIHAKPGTVVTNSTAAAAAGWTGASGASLLQLTQAYEESLADLSITLQLSKRKADEAAALREQLLQAYQQRNATAATAASSDNRKRTQPQQQQKQRQQTATRQATSEVAAAKASSGQAQAAGSVTASGASRRRSEVSNTWCTRRSGKRVRVFIGVYTGFSTLDVEPRYNYAARRAALRASWFPGNATERAQLEAEYGVVVRFVVGSSGDAKEEAAILQEEREHGDILRLPLKEDYRFLPNKTRTFFKMVTDKWEPEWLIRMDDAVYLNIPRLLEAARQWDKMGAEYVGCMKHGVVRTDPGSRWYEPAHILAGPTYWLHSYGSIYAVAGPTASCVISAAFDRLRLLSNEDTSVGLWMLASNVVHFEDMRLCSPVCTNASVAVQRTECAGLCNPIEDLKLLHANSNCSMAPEGHLLYHKSYPEHAVFEQMWVE